MHCLYKENDRATDESTARGFSTDQRISIEGLFIQKPMQKQQQIETSMVALIVHERAISKQIDSAERRAEKWCETYDASNSHWKIFDDLLVKQIEITSKMEEMSRVATVDQGLGSDSIVSEFMNMSSPHKKSKHNKDIEILSSDSDADGNEEVAPEVSST